VSDHRTLTGAAVAADAPAPAPPAAPARRRSRWPTGRQRRRAIPYLLVLPGFVFVCALLLYPAIEVLVSSVFDQTGRSIYDREFVGLEHFRRLVGDDQVIATFVRTAGWVVSVTALSYVVGLGIALLLHRRFRGRGVVRSVLLIPWAVPFVAAAFAWQSLFDARYGILNYLLRRTGAVDEGVNWLGSPDVALWAVVAVAVWKQVPFIMVTMLAALQSIDPDHYEAAELDGARAWARFRYVTLPAIRGTSLVVIAFVAMWTYNTFELIYLMTGGGPGVSTQIVSIYTYLSAFNFNQANYAAAIGTGGLLVLALLLVPVARVMSRRGG
jgi:ABC-type sugar transport system permease subunit